MSDATSIIGCGLPSRLKYSLPASRSLTPSASASRRRLPPAAATISKCSGPASLNTTAFGVSAMAAAKSAMAIGLAWTSASPIATRCSAKFRSRNLSKSVAPSRAFVVWSIAPLWPNVSCPSTNKAAICVQAAAFANLPATTFQRKAPPHGQAPAHRSHCSRARQGGEILRGGLRHEARRPRAPWCLYVGRHHQRGPAQAGRRREGRHLSLWHVGRRSRRGGEEGTEGRRDLSRGPSDLAELVLRVQVQGSARHHLRPDPQGL